MNENNEVNETQSFEMIDLKKIDYNQVCRGCLSQDNELKPMYTQFETNLHGNVVLSDMFMECTSIQINYNDNLPKQLCDNCIYQINQSFLFKKNCQRIEESLLHYEKHKNLFVDDDNINNDQLSSTGTTTTSDFRINDDNTDEHLKIAANVEYLEEGINNVYNDENIIIEEKLIIKEECPKVIYPQDDDTNFEGVKTKTSLIPTKTSLDKNGNDNSKRKFTCEVCSKSFKAKSHLRTHSFVHTGERPYKCAICNKSFTQPNSLKTHQLTHSDVKQYQCDHCKKLFKTYIALSQHLLIHKGIKKYNCTYCDKRFTQSSNLNYHLRTHTGEKPYECAVCLKTFAIKGNLTVHERIHTGITPYVCSICLRGFTDSSSLKKHQRVKHSEELNKNVKIKDENINISNTEAATIFIIKKDSDDENAN